MTNCNTEIICYLNVLDASNASFVELLVTFQPGRVSKGCLGACILNLWKIVNY